MGYNSGFKGLNDSCLGYYSMYDHSLFRTFEEIVCHSPINEKKTKYLKNTKKETRNESLNINNLQREQVQQYKYLGSIVNVSNSIKEEIKERIVLGTKAYYANLKFFKSRLATKQSKLKLYRTVIRPIVTYA